MLIGKEGVTLMTEEEFKEILDKEETDTVEFKSWINARNNKYSSLDVICHFPLNMLIKNPQLLNDRECQYAMNPATHLDFLIYNRISKKPVLAIEVDGYEFHKKDTVQASRDLLKDRIMDLYEIPLLRFKTNGCGEREKIVGMLDKLVG